MFIIRYSPHGSEVKILRAIRMKYLGQLVRVYLTNGKKVLIDEGNILEVRSI